MKDNDTIFASFWQEKGMDITYDSQSRKGLNMHL